MKLYYKAVTGDNKPIEGIIDARDAQEVAAYLRSKGLIPIKIQKKEKNGFESLTSLFTNKVKPKEIVSLTRQLSSMLTSGITLLRALEILKSQIVNKALIEILNSIIGDIQEGLNFSSAISKYPQIFPPVYISLIKSSEESGLLDKAFLRLADTLEKQQKLKGTIKSALTYPVIVVSMMVAVGIIMMLFVMPQITKLYQNLNVSLPLPTQIVIGISNLMISFWPIPLVFVFISVFLYRRWHRTVEGRLIADSMLLKIPIFGTLIKKTILAEFSRTLGVLLGTGTLVVQALSQAADSASNIHYKNAIIDVAKRVEKGITIGDAMSTYTLFPPNLTELVKIGEQTGKLDETLIKASEYFESEVDQSVKTLSTAMEPAIMIVLGIGVAFLVFSIITPIYQIMSSIQ